MKHADFAPIAAWIMWEMLWDEEEPADAPRDDDPGREPPAGKKAPRRQ